ncbi:MgtC/SapB family protein [Magnetospirillum molischianum]|uniref:Protein MgtC n=1 Tax=Magnetospirillum molischianum DSM 120 TaxID=1150626 RepID=H8FST9_MAGML|nr:MgtC/SapB family protein [Magnetospirillum molischianum]CCG41427.1 Protein mgtC [Magnetospirillum molischianum DSM 120]
MGLFMEWHDLILRLGGAVLFGAIIGIERQWRQRMAGLRTNALVSLGAASFVVFSTITAGDASPTRIAAQIVSGIGFLGAGVIMREGVNVRGLNTAATLWCSAAVGTFTGAGHLVESGIVAAFVVLTNLLLRPLVGLINRQPLPTTTEVETEYTVHVTCRGDGEAHIRALLLQGLVDVLSLRRLESQNIEGTDHVSVTAILSTLGRNDLALEKTVGRLSLEASVTAARWQVGSPLDS